MYTNGSNNIQGLDINFNQKLTALPKTITDMPAYVYSRASTKNVIQDGQFVSLRANLCTFSKGDLYMNAGGSTPPTVTSSVTEDGELCSSALFTSSSATGSSGSLFRGTQASSGQVVNATNVLTRTFNGSSWIKLSRALTGTEAIIYYWTGANGFDQALTINSSNSSSYLTWTRVSSTRTTPTTVAGYLYPMVYISQTLSSNLTVFMRDHQCTEGLTLYDYTQSYSTPAAQFGTHWDTYGGGYAPTIQPAATNLATYSQDHSNAAWVKTNCTVVSNSVVAPDGSTTADKVTATATAVTTMYQAIVATSTRMTFSCFIKQGTRSTVNLMVRNETTATSFQSGLFTFSTMAVTGTGWEVIPIQNGWYFLRYTNQATETITIGDTIRIYDGANGNSVTAGQYWYVWGTQFEAGVWNTAYIPTTSASVSRSANQYGIDYLNTCGSYGALIEGSATNLITYSTLTAGGGTNTAPTGWNNNSSGAGSFYPSTSTLGTDVTAYTFDSGVLNSGGVQRIGQYAVSVAASAVYIFSAYVEYTDGIAYANDIILATNLPTGATYSFVPCDANPSGYEYAVVRTGRLVLKVTTSTTLGTGRFWIGSGCNGSGRGGVVRVSRPQLELNAAPTSYILTTTATATRAADRLQILLGTAPNYISRSNEFSHANWSKTNCTFAQNATDPFGVANNAWTLTVTATTTTNCPNANFILAPSTTMTYSIYVKQGTRASCGFAIHNATTSTTVVLSTFTFATATVTNSTGTTTAENIGSGWYRLKATVSSGISIGDRISGYAGATGSTYTAGDTILVFGAQLESGSSASTYSQTTTGAIVSTPFSTSWTQNNPFCLYADFRKLTNQGLSAGEFIAQLNPSNGIDTTSRHSMYTNTTYGVQALVDGSATMGLNPFNVVNKRTRYACNFQTNNFLTSMNGLTMTSDTVGAISPYLSILSIGQNTAGLTSNLNSAILYNVKFITSALTQAQLNGLTNI